MKKIVVPCDFSPTAVQAYLQAVDIADQASATVHLVHIIEPPVMQDSLMMPTLNFEAELMKELEEKANTEFKALHKKSRESGVKVTHEVRYGAVSTQILECIHEQHADLVLMGSHGASGLREYLIGSNAERIVRQSPVPVMVMKKEPVHRIHNIVFPNELKLDNQDELVAKVKDLQNFFGATIHIVWINTPSNFMTDRITRQKLESFARHHMFRDYTINIYNHLSIEEGIHEFSKMIDGDLIALGTHSRKGLAHMMNGSLAENVVNHTDNLVWTFTLKKDLAEV